MPRQGVVASSLKCMGQGAVGSSDWLGAWGVFEVALELIFICFEADSEKFKYKVMAFLTNNLR